MCLALEQPQGCTVQVWVALEQDTFWGTLRLSPEKTTLAPSLIDCCGTKIASQNRVDHGGRRRVGNHAAAEIAEFFALPAGKKKSPGVSFKIAGSSQRPRPQVAAAARFRGHSDHGTLSSLIDCREDPGIRALYQAIGIPSSRLYKDTWFATIP